MSVVYYVVETGGHEPLVYDLGSNKFDEVTHDATHMDRTTALKTLAAIKIKNSAHLRGKKLEVISSGTLRERKYEAELSARKTKYVRNPMA
jgi:hypothetical protein